MATLCQYNITGLCCVCITAGCLQATSVCGTHYGDGSNLTNISSPTGTVVYMPGASTTPSGYLPADGTLYAKASYSNLGTCYNGKTFGADALLSGTNYNLNFVDYVINPSCGMCYGPFKCCFTTSPIPDCYHSAVGYVYDCTASSCVWNAVYYMRCQVGGGTAAGWGQSWAGLIIKNRTCTGFVLLPVFGYESCDRCCAVGLKLDNSVVTNGIDFIDCTRRACYYAPLYSCGFKRDSRICHCCVGSAAHETSAVICKYVVNWGFRGGGYAQIDVFDTDFPRCCCIQTAWCNADLKQTYVICCTTGFKSEPARGAVVNFLCNVVACGACPFMGLITGNYAQTTNNGLEAFWFGGVGAGEATQYSTNNTRYFRFSATVTMDSLCQSSTEGQVSCYPGHPGQQYMHNAQDHAACYDSCAINDPTTINVGTRGGFYYNTAYGVGYNKMISFGAACFGVLTIAANCTCSITCYPITCIGSQCVKHLCYSNATNYWYALTCSSDLWSSPGSDGVTWTMSLCRTSLRSGLSLWNLDNKFAISTPYGGIWITCNGTSWSCVWNPNKMLMGDNSRHLVKAGNYYLGSGTIHTCDLCCSGYTFAPGWTSYSSALNALVSVNNRARSSPMMTSNQGGFMNNISWNAGLSSGYNTPAAKEVAIYCSSTSSPDAIYWKWCRLGTSCNCSTACGGKNIMIQDVNFNGDSNKVYYMYTMNCQLGTCCCLSQSLGMYNLATCTHVDNICVCCYSFPGTDWCVQRTLSGGTLNVSLGTADRLILSWSSPYNASQRLTCLRSFVGCVTSATCTWCTSQAFTTDGAHTGGRDACWKYTRTQIALTCSSDPLGTQPCCCGWGIAFKSDNSGVHCFCGFACTNCTFQQLGYMPYEYNSSGVPLIYTCITPAPNCVYKFLSQIKPGQCEAISAAVGSVLVPGTCNYYYGCYISTPPSLIAATLVAAGAAPLQILAGDGATECSYNSIGGMDNNGPAHEYYITTLNGKAFTKDGTVSPCFDTGTCFRVPNAGSGYYVKT